MISQHTKCGDPVNESEERALRRCKEVLGSLGEDWVLLSNYALLNGNSRQPDDLDLVYVGARGVLLIEVKHWNPAWMNLNQPLVDAEVKKLKSKTERLGSLVRRACGNYPVYVQQCFLFTRPAVGGGAKHYLLGGALEWTLKDMAQGFQRLPQNQLSAGQIQSIVHGLEPTAGALMNGKIRRIAEYQNLEMDSAPDERFHRIYRGEHRRTLEKVVLHLYDLSASDEKDARHVAERGFRTLQQLQKCRCVPRFRDSFQDLSEFPGELCYYTVFKPDAPPLARRRQDKTWTVEQRVDFARLALEAIREINGLNDEQDIPIVHRNLSPQTILVDGRNRPVIIGFEVARLPLTRTLAGSAAILPRGECVAPEVQAGGLAAASLDSDVFSVCSALATLFAGDETETARQALDVLQQGQEPLPADRADLEQLIVEMQAILVPSPLAGHEPPAPAPLVPSVPPPAEFWCEGTTIKLRARFLRVLGRLGTGGVGSAFKVEHIDPLTEENFGTYVAKVIRNEDDGKAALDACLRVRSHSSHPALATVFEVADEWAANQVLALLRWVEGESLHSIAGLLKVLAEEEDIPLEKLLWRWLREICGGLSVLHANGLVHGDVSPRNLICQQNSLTLTDYDW